MLQGAYIQLGLGLRAVIGLQPHQVATPALLATQAQHSGLVEGLARRQVVASPAVEFTIVQALADVQCITVDQEAIADHDVLSAEGNIHAVLSEHLEEIARTPAEIGILDLRGALGAIGEARRITVAPARRAEQGEGAITTAHVAQPLIETQTILDVAFAPGRAAFLQATTRRVVLTAMKNAECAFEAALQVRVVIGIEFGCSGR